MVIAWPFGTALSVQCDQLVSAVAATDRGGGRVDLIMLHDVSRVRPGLFTCVQPMPPQASPVDDLFSD
jgi:hypothetical protein